MKCTCHLVINIFHPLHVAPPPPPPHKVWVSGFPSVNRNRILVLAIMKKLKNGRHFVNMHCTEMFQITDPRKVRVSGLLFTIYSRLYLCCLWDLLNKIYLEAENINNIVTENMLYTSYTCYTKSLARIFKNISGGSRISPRRGRQLPGGGAPTYDFAKNFPKTAWNLKNLDPGGGRVQNFTM